jgi:hypothetical protein
MPAQTPAEKRAATIAAKKKKAALAAAGIVEAPWLAFFEVQGPMGQTYHATIRAGATKESIDEMYDLLAYAGTVGAQEAFSFISEYNEFGQRLTLSRLGDMRVAKHDAEVKKAAARNRANRAATRQSAPPQAAPPQAAPPQAAPPTQAQTRPQAQQAQQPAQTQQRSASSTNGRNRYWDLKKSPIEVNKIEIQGTNDDPKLKIYCSNPRLSFPAFNTPTSVMVAIIGQHYDLDTDAMRSWLSHVGEVITLNHPWLIHWEPSAKNAKWKDVIDVEIPEKADQRKRDNGAATAAESAAAGDDWSDENPPPGYIEEDDVPF